MKIFAGSSLRRALAGLAVVCVAAQALVVQAQPEPAGFAEIHQLNKTVESRSGETVRIVNRFGNVRIRAVPDAAEGSMRATVQSTSGDAVPAAIRTTEGHDGPVYEVVPGKNADELIRVDVVVALPDKAGIDVEMEHGDFTMHPASYPVRLRARSGKVRLRTSGRVDVEVPDGHVIYSPPEGGSSKPPAGGRIQTSGAPVDVLVGCKTALIYRVVSGAAATTDSLALLKTRRRDGRAVLFGDRESNRLLEIQTDHAPVRLVVEGVR